MDGDRQDESLTDGAALERDLEALLAVEPSADFVARVRSRVADEAISSGWSFAWRIAAAAAMVVAVVAGVAVWRSLSMGRAEPVAPQTVHTAVPPADARAPVTQTARSTETPALSHTPPLVPVARRGVSEDAPRAAIEMTLPDVIIEESEKRGFDLLLEELRDGKDAAAIARAASRTATPGPPWLDINPVVIEPLPQVMIFQGEGQ